MKSTKSMLFALSMVASTLLFNGCADNCADVNCLNGGACNDGTCICPDGFGGEYCQTLEPCELITCENGGTCDNGECDCAEGYNGTNCENEIRARFLGTFRGTRNNTSCPGPFFATIAAGTGDIWKIVISNLCDYYQLEATVNPSGNSLVISSQSIFYPPHNTVYTFTGTGTISGDVITLTFTPNYALGNSTAPMILVRQ